MKVYEVRLTYRVTDDGNRFDDTVTYSCVASSPEKALQLAKEQWDTKDKGLIGYPDPEISKIDIVDASYHHEVLIEEVA